MKLIFLFIIISSALRVRAFFFDDFRQAMHHVEHGFEKMLSDVVTDMEDTIHCTVAAMEHILIMNGILDKLSEYRKKCPDYSEVKASATQRETRVDSSDLVAKDASQEIHSSIYNVNKTLNNILSKRAKDDTRDSLSDSLRNETNRLNEVSAMLRKELEKIFSNVRGELDKINFEQKSPEDVVRDEIKLLQKAEKDGNNSEVDEIRHVVDEAINVLKSDESSNLERRNNNEIDKIVKELENTESKFESYEASRDRDAEKLNKDHNLSAEDNIFALTGKKDFTKHNTNHKSESSNYVSSLYDSFEKNEQGTINEVLDMIKDRQVVNLFFQDDESDGDGYGNQHLFDF